MLNDQTVLQRSPPKWRTRLARRAFIEAFSERYTLPLWVYSVYILPFPHDAGNAIAVVRTNAGDAMIKVLPSTKDIQNFWDDYPNADVLVVVIPEGLSSEEIRERVFSSIEEAA